MQRNKVTVIDGTKQSVAPAPSRGLAKLVYQVVKELGGATETQIKKYLPAVSDDVDQYINRKKFDNCLYSSVYSGYLITDGNKYRIAPMSYYEARQEIVHENKARHARGDTKRVRRHPEKDHVTYVRPLWHWAFITCVGVITAVMGFFIGFFTGLHIV